ncbi:hypothetical protein SAMN05421786_11538 [Chryseobacterium ureilyticum]|uniref:Lipoprotein n=1 Tax=Chryseobacterium ureilyticum TaxID=373668 RepID=A0A1N7QSZ6_9FLAO|nr:hypothetical protein [Chryseobacterium ureilyticum]SIT25607.1 hypothetical protein SAMN05421786_11538 [Chryseobacterium ureilyticum]
MKTIFSFIVYFLFIGALVSCKARKPSPPAVIENTKETIITVRDTIFKVDADSSYYQAYIECVNGTPVLNETTNTKNNSKPGIVLDKPKVKITGELLTVQCDKKAQALFKQWREVYIKEHEQKPIYVEIPVHVETPLNWFQNVQIWLGRIFLFLIAIVSLVFILRWKKVI